MSRMIQVRDVPDEVHRTLKSRAALAGLSLSEYIRRDLETAAAHPSVEELDARVRSKGRSKLTADQIVGFLREVRDG